MEYANKHELEARVNGLQIALNQTQADAIEYLENAVSSIISIMGAQNLNAYKQGFAKATNLTDEKIGTVENKRKAWREELAGLMPLLESMPDCEEGDEV